MHRLASRQSTSTRRQTIGARCRLYNNVFADMLIVDRVISWIYTTLDLFLVRL